MKFSVYLLSIVGYILTLRPVHSRRWSPEQERLSLVSVSRFQGVENYYFQLKKKRKSLRDGGRLVSVWLLNFSSSFSRSEPQKLDIRLSAGRSLHAEENVPTHIPQ